MLQMLRGMNTTGFHLLTEKSFNSIFCLDHNEVIKKKKSKGRPETREERAAWCKTYSSCCLHEEGAELHYCACLAQLFLHNSLFSKDDLNYSSFYRSLMKTLFHVLDKHGRNSPAPEDWQREEINDKAARY